MKGSEFLPFQKLSGVGLPLFCLTWSYQPHRLYQGPLLKRQTTTRVRSPHREITSSASKPNIPFALKHYCSEVQMFLCKRPKRLKKITELATENGPELKSIKEIWISLLHASAFSNGQGSCRGQSGGDVYALKTFPPLVKNRQRSEGVSCIFVVFLSSGINSTLFGVVHCIPRVF